MNQNSPSILILSSDAQRKQKLRELLRSIYLKPKFRFIATHKQVDEDFFVGVLYDFLFIDSGQESLGIETLLTLIKGLPKEYKPRVVLTLRGISTDETSSVLPFYLQGADGFIAEPFSAEQLSGLLKTLQQKTGDIDLVAREKRASKILIDDMIQGIDALATSLSNHDQERYVKLKRCKVAAKRLRALTHESAEELLDLLAPEFEKAVPTSNKNIAKNIREKSPPKPCTEILQIISERNIALEEISRLSKLDMETINQIISGNISIDATSAHALSLAIGRSPNEWLKLQADFDNWSRSNKRP